MARYWVRLSGFSRETMFCVATWLGTDEGSQGLNRHTRFCLYAWLGTVEGSHGSTERIVYVYIHG
jgi:hypothetical protein